MAQPVGPQAGRAGRAWVKIKIVFSFEGNGGASPLLCNYFALVIYILEMLYDLKKKIKVSWLFNGP